MPKVTHHFSVENIDPSYRFKLAKKLGIDADRIDVRLGQYIYIEGDVGLDGQALDALRVTIKHETGVSHVGLSVNAPHPIPSDKYFWRWCSKCSGPTDVHRNERKNGDVEARIVCKSILCRYEARAFSGAPPKVTDPPKVTKPPGVVTFSRDKRDMVTCVDCRLDWEHGTHNHKCVKEGEHWQRGAVGGYGRLWKVASVHSSDGRSYAYLEAVGDARDVTDRVELIQMTRGDDGWHRVDTPVDPSLLDDGPESDDNKFVDGITKHWVVSADKMSRNGWQTLLGPRADESWPSCDAITQPRQHHRTYTFGSTDYVATKSSPEKPQLGDLWVCNESGFSAALYRVENCRDPATVVLRRWDDGLQQWGEHYVKTYGALRGSPDWGHVVKAKEEKPKEPAQAKRGNLYVFNDDIFRVACRSPTEPVVGDLWVYDNGKTSAQLYLINKVDIDVEVIIERLDDKSDSRSFHYEYDSLSKPSLWQHVVKINEEIGNIESMKRLEANNARATRANDARMKELSNE